VTKHFEADRDCPALRRAKAAYIEVLLKEMLPLMRMAARGLGYAITVHGSLCRDVDLVAIPWVEHPGKPEELVTRLTGVISAFAGRAVVNGDLTDKPHGRKALTIITAGDTYIDLSIMPCVEPKTKEKK
jgi:hypothetical protein